MSRNAFSTVDTQETVTLQGLEYNVSKMRSMAKSYTNLPEYKNYLSLLVNESSNKNERAQFILYNQINQLSNKYLKFKFLEWKLDHDPDGSYKEKPALKNSFENELKKRIEWSKHPCPDFLVKKTPSRAPGPQTQKNNENKRSPKIKFGLLYKISLHRR